MISNPLLLENLRALAKEFPELAQQTVDFRKDLSPHVSQEASSEIEPPKFLRGPSPKIQVQRSPIHGYGIFAVADIEADELLEESLLLELGLRMTLITDAVIKDYVFAKKDDFSPEYGHKVLFGLGYLSLYNHQDEPNAKQKFDYQRKIGRVYAKTPIKSGDELFISYGRNYFRLRKLFQGLSKEVQQRLLLSDEIKKGKY
jgi:hypothetical protein